MSKYTLELSRSKTWRQNDYDDLWRRMKDLYKGNHWEAGGAQDQIVVNMAFATINVINPSMSVSNPRFTVNARKAEHEAQAMFTEEVINYLWRINRYHSQFRLCVNDWLIFGHGWMKVGYKFVTEPKVKSADPASDDRGRRRRSKTGKRRRATSSRRPTCSMTARSPNGSRLTTCSSTPTAAPSTTSRWIAQRIRRPVNDVRVDRRYEPKARKEAQPTTSSRFDTSRPPPRRATT